MITVESNFLDENKLIQYIFTDGSCFPNNSSKESKGGYASIFANGPLCGKILCGSLDNKIANATNQRAEGIAILKSMQYLLKFTDWEDCILVTDSNFWIQMIYDYMPNWNDNKFKSKKNPDLTKKVYETYLSIKETKKNFKIIHMYSHNKSNWSNCKKTSKEYYFYFHNDIADQIADCSKNMPKGKSLIVDCGFPIKNQLKDVILNLAKIR